MGCDMCMRERGCIVRHSYNIVAGGRRGEIKIFGELSIRLGRAFFGGLSLLGILLWLNLEGLSLSDFFRHCVWGEQGGDKTIWEIAQCSLEGFL